MTYNGWTKDLTFEQRDANMRRTLAAIAEENRQELARQDAEYAAHMEYLEELRARGEDEWNADAWQFMAREF